MSDARAQELMRRAIAIAWTGFGRTRPNPVVGCVIARGGVVLAEGVTAAGGRPHAEEQALLTLPGGAPGADAFVTLEPCARRSSGALACSDRLIRAGVARVFIASLNPDPLSGGEGPARLTEAGVEVVEGFLAEEAAPLYEGFIHRVRTGFPLVAAAPGRGDFEAAFEPAAGEGLRDALRRYASGGYSRLWVPDDGPLAAALAAEGLLHRPR